MCWRRCWRWRRSRGGLLFSLDARPAAAQTPDEPDDWPPVRAVDGQGVYGTPEACPDGFEVLFDYKQTLRKFKKGFNGAISDEDRGTVAELVVSAGEKRREVDRSLCVRDLPPCPVSVFQAGQTPTVYMADPADPLFEHRGLDANFAVRSQHVVDFGADFNAAWLAQTTAIGQGYRLSENPKYWRIKAPGRDKPFNNMDADVGNHEPFEEMHPDRCVDAVAEPDPAVVPSDDSYSECVADKPEVVVPDDGGTASYLPYAKMAFVFATAAEPAVGMCVRFARKACPPGTLLTAVPQRFEPAAAPGDESDTDTDAETPDPVYAVEPIGEMVVQHRCRSRVRRTWTCPVDPKGKVIYEPMNQFNRCTERPASPAAGRSEAPCLETEGTPAREEAFKGFFGAAECDDYVRGNFAADPAACSSFKFADVGDAGLEPDKDYPRDPYQKLNGYLKAEKLTVLTEVDAGVSHWCKFNPGLLRSECHGSKRPGKLEDCGEDVMKDAMKMERESVCLLTKNDSGGCAAIVHAIECLATAAAIKANDDDHSDLGKALKVWQDYHRNCAPCTDSPFNPGSGCETSASSSADSSTALVDQDLVDMLTWFVYGREQHHFDTYLREVEKSNKMKGTTLKARLANDLLKDAVELFARRGEHQGALFNGGGPNSLGYPTSDRPPCPDAVNNKWNLAKDAAFDAYIKWYVVGLWPVSLMEFETRGNVKYFSNRLKYFEDNVAKFNALEPLEQTAIRDYNEFASRALSSGESSGACFDLSPIAPACRVPFSGSLSHRSRNGTGVVLSNMRTDIRVRDLPSPVGMENSRWMPEPSGGGDADPEPFESAGPAIVDSIADVDPKHGIKCAFAGDPPHVELVITEMWPDQQLDYDGDGVIEADGDFIKEFKELFDNEPLDWWGLNCKASELVSKCGENENEAGYLTEVKQSCEESWTVNWTVKECRRRLTAQQGLDYLPDLSGDDLHEGAKREEILRRNQERVTCKDVPEVPELEFSCPWQPSRSGYFRLAAVAIWEIKHCIDSINTHKCEIEGPNDREDVPYGKMGAMTVSEPLGVVVYSATSEGRSVALEDNLNLGG